MPTVPANTLSSTTTSSKPARPDNEPDKGYNQGKGSMRAYQSMITDAKKNQAAKLEKVPDTPEARMRLAADHKQAMQTIKSFAPSSTTSS